MSVFFACLVLVSSTSFMVGIHHCGGHLKNIALFSKAEACEMEQQVPACHRINNTSCCDDLAVIHDNEDFSGPVAVEYSPVLFADDLATDVLLAEVIPASSPATVSVYHPPILDMDRPVVHRVFLI